jgi:hypothetical protein
VYNTEGRGWRVEGTVEGVGFTEDGKQQTADQPGAHIECAGLKF